MMGKPKGVNGNEKKVAEERGVEEDEVTGQEELAVKVGQSGQK